MADADRLLELSRQAQGEFSEDSEERQRIVAAAAELLGQLLLQDVERAKGGVSLKDGVSRDRMMSVHDPEMRHGHKSSSRRFDGHKAAIVVDTDSQLITAVEVLPGNAPDNLGALELVEASEATTGVPVEEAMGDAAYGDGDTRQAFADAGRRLVARVPGRPDRKPCCSRPERCSKALTMTNIECAEWVVEHRLARLVQLGIRQSRYFGRVKTRFQLYLAATVANLTLVAGKLGRSGHTGGGATGRSVILNIVPFVVAHAAANFCGVRLGQL